MANGLLSPILDDEAITRGLGDAEARILIEWLVDRAEHVQQEYLVEEQAQATVGRLCRRARSISRFVTLWEQEQRAAACQLAATERFSWPLPTDAVDPCDLMQAILSWEGRTTP
jgi:hypothetical protein